VAQSIPILSEPWLSDVSCINDNYDVSHVTGGPSVQSLIDTTAKVWNSDVIQHVFSPEDTRRILDTPLIDQVIDDRLVWKAEKNGYYLVKSAYRLCVDVLTDSSHLRREGYMQGIWRLKVPPKIKNLVWRICWDMVHTRRRLQDKGVQCPLSCVALIIYFLTVLFLYRYDNEPVCGLSFSRLILIREQWPNAFLHFSYIMM
jgi:hypothetical protein